MTKRTGAKYERELKHILEQQGFLVIRAAGSHDIDLVALKPSRHILIEVKSTKSMKKRLNGKSYDQYHKLHELSKQGYEIVYAIRHVGSGEWYGFQPIEPAPGVINLQDHPHLQSLLDMVEYGIIGGDGE